MKVGVDFDVFVLELVQTSISFPWYRGDMFYQGKLSLGGCMVVMFGFASSWEHDHDRFGGCKIGIG